MSAVFSMTTDKHGKKTEVNGTEKECAEAFISFAKKYNIDEMTEKATFSYNDGVSHFQLFRTAVGTCKKHNKPIEAVYSVHEDTTLEEANNLNNPKM